jgi:hypothetical protein
MVLTYPSLGSSTVVSRWSSPVRTPKVSDGDGVIVARLGAPLTSFVFAVVRTFLIQTMVHRNAIRVDAKSSPSNVLSVAFASGSEPRAALIGCDCNAPVAVVQGQWLPSRKQT